MDKPDRDLDQDAKMRVLEARIKELEERLKYSNRTFFVLAVYVLTPLALVGWMLFVLSK